MGQAELTAVSFPKMPAPKLRGQDQVFLSPPVVVKGHAVETQSRQTADYLLLETKDLIGQQRHLRHRLEQRSCHHLDAHTDPDSDPALATEINERFGFQPLVLGLLDPSPFYFYMVLEQGDQAVPVPLPGALDEASLRRIYFKIRVPSPSRSIRCSP